MMISRITHTKKKYIENYRKTKKNHKKRNLIFNNNNLINKTIFKSK